MKMNILSFFRAAPRIAALILAALCLSARAETELVVYTAVEAEDLPRYAERFESANPGIKIKWVRDSTGIITAKLLAEKDNPRADVIWGLAGTSLLLFKREGMLAAYKPRGAERLDPRFIDAAEPPYWAGMNAWVAAICVNTVEAQNNNLPTPRSWRDLTKPAYRGHIAMPNPASSGTGFLDVSSWLQIFGEKGGWQFMDGLHKNIAYYTHSGSKPCKDAAHGEVAIGVSFAFRAAKSKSEGAPLEIVIPREGIGWDMEASAIVAGTDYLAEAQKLMDFTVSGDAMRLYNEGYAVVAVPGIAKPVPHFPPNVVDAMIENDFEFAANNRERILKEWQRRYDEKSEPES
jgi:iron(III) transport system substrate-binding protein